LLLGERASTEVLRKGADKSIVEGIFDVAANRKVKKFCEQNEIDFADELIVRREVSLKGTNRCFLNDSPVTLNLIKEVGDLLVDLHGQHEHQSLLRTETHIEMLDGFANLDAGLNEYTKSYYELLLFQRELKELREKESVLKEKRELFQFQIKEIDAVDPHIDEEEKLAQELNILENSEKLLSITSDIYSELYENENSVMDQLGSVKHKLAEIERIDKSFADSLTNFDSALALLNEVSSFVRSYKDKIDLEPEKLEEIRARLGAIILLKKKYGGSVNSVIEHREKIGAEFDLAENFSQRISEMQKQIDSSRKLCGSIAKKLSTERVSVSKKVKKEIETALRNLGIADSQFEVRIVNETAESGSENYILVDSKKYKFNNHGIDEVEFYISTNAGEDAKPLVKVASGGEISRIMLALKSTLAKSDKLPILIFDEIDTGVSGRIAQKVGQTLKELASVHQIIAITHLPQIAGLADIHFAVEKRKSADRVVSSICKLDSEKRVEEVAKLMSGEEITEAALSGARELMSISKK
ncbi:MAG: DNA repair protein RecN, partial [Ignavibacteria bacterium]|nr:DNA repair protein RecN [Ignavibacteria bacterium]